MVRIRTPLVPPVGKNPSDQERKIDGGPCHCLEEIKALARSEGEDALLLATKRCSRDVSNHELDMEDIVDMICDLEPSRFKGSEWCRASDQGPWYACDAYVVIFEGVNPENDYQFKVEYYLKLHLKKKSNNELILIFSLHL